MFLRGLLKIIVHFSQKYQQFGPPSPYFSLNPKKLCHFVANIWKPKCDKHSRFAIGHIIQQKRL
jgi:hypothetical protein